VAVPEITENSEMNLRTEMLTKILMIKLMEMKKELELKFRLFPNISLIKVKTLLRLKKNKEEEISKLIIKIYKKKNSLSFKAKQILTKPLKIWKLELENKPKAKKRDKLITYK